MKRRILVTDGEQRAALAVVRSLGRAGHDVWVCSPRARALAGASRFSRGEAQVTDPLEDGERSAADVRRLCERWQIDLLIPIGEASALALLPDSARPPGVSIPFPSFKVFRAICDKREVLEIAGQAGVPVPEQVVLRDRAEVSALPSNALRFPVVIKPARSIGENGVHRLKLEVRHAADHEQLRQRLDELPDAAFPLLIQQRVVGPGTGVFVLLWDDQVRAVFAHRRLREKPPSGGVSVYSESVVADSALVDRAVGLLRHFHWQGVAMVELKVDAATGTPYLMEINGRFWGSLQLAIDAGVDFPRLLVDAVSGEPGGRPPSYRAGVRVRWWWGDVDHLIARLRRSARTLHLPAEMGGRGKVIRDFLRIRAGDHSEVFRWSDPAPAFRETLDWLARR